MKIYLDNCCYGRPFDDNSNETVKLESDATLYIREKIIHNELDLVTSFMIHYENEQKPDEHQKRDIEKFFKTYRKLHIGVEFAETLTDIVQSIMFAGIKRKDAYHIACSIFAECDYLITVDKRLLKFQSEKIKIINPIEFVKILKE